MDKCIWEELCYDLASNLRRLLDSTSDPFWRNGWIFTRIQHRVAFIYNGQIVLDTPLPLEGHKNSRILSVKPIAVSLSEQVQYLVKGFNFSQSTRRLLCALEGKYLVQESCADIMERANSFIDHNEIQSLSFSCNIPNVTGRGFIEVEDHGLDSSFFPFIVAEKDVCSEICTLESVIEEVETTESSHGSEEKETTRNQALDFIHEMGWLLHKSHLKCRLGQGNRSVDLYPFRRFRWLIEFSLERDWCAVVKKLLGILFDGIVDAGQHTSVELAIEEVGLLHRAVRRNCRSMVEVLLRYHWDGVLNKSGKKQTKQVDDVYYLFRPDATGPGGLTPLHIAACQDGSENVLDALTDDPGLVGIKAWGSIRDATGLTPNEYASLRGHYSYIKLVHRKINKKPGSGHVILDIPSILLDGSIKQKLSDGLKSVKAGSFETEKSAMVSSVTQCRQCEQRLAYGSSRTSLAIYRPAMLSMVAIAALCVCVALLFKSSPEVLYVFRPFRWELLKYGSS